MTAHRNAGPTDLPSPGLTAALPRPTRRRLGRYLLLGRSLSPLCGKLPFWLDEHPELPPLDYRAEWRWISVPQFFGSRRCRFSHACRKYCPLSDGVIAEAVGSTGFKPVPTYRALVLWIPCGVFPSVGAFVTSAARHGVSWPLRRLPDGLRVGPEGDTSRTLVLLAHRHARVCPDGSTSPGLVRAFRPEDLVYRRGPGDSPTRLAKVARRAISIVDDSSSTGLKPVPPGAP